MAGSEHATASASARPDFAFILKKSALSAAVAFGLFLFMIGIRTDAGSNGELVYWTRFDDLAIIVGIVFVGSIALELARWALGRGQIAVAMPPQLAAGLQTLQRARRSP